MSQWRIEFDDKAAKQFRRLGTVDQRRVRSFLEDRVLASDDPRSQGKALSGPLTGLWRYRVGDLRIVVRIEHQVLVVYVIDIDDRSRIYR